MKLALDSKKPSSVVTDTNRYDMGDKKTEKIIGLIGYILFTLG
jgi:hypothetical protein